MKMFKTITLLLFSLLFITTCDEPTKPDTTDPTVSITYPISGSSVSGLVVVTASAEDNESVEKVEFYIDGQLKNTDQDLPWEYLWDTEDFADGNQHSLYAKAFDEAGNTASSSIVLITTPAPNSVPVISSITADPSSIELNGTSTITCDATDDDGDNLSYSWSATGGNISGSSSMITYTAPNTDGTYTITCTVNDGNGGEDSETVNVTVTSGGGGTGTVTDIDGNVYQTIIIGNQEWMMENLKVTHYRNGDSIPTGHSNSEWGNLDDTETGAYAVYDGNQSYADTYGYLYNWYAVDDSRNIAPDGWHVPTDDEWKTLEMHLGMSQSEADGSGWWRGTDEGGKLKEEGTTHWNSPNTGATNESGFTALPGGYRIYSGSYGDMGYRGFYWSSTEIDSFGAWSRILDYSYSAVYRYDGGKHHGCSIRCIRD